MKWIGRRGSGNIIDLRGLGSKQIFAGGGVTGLITLFIVWITGGNPLQLIGLWIVEDKIIEQVVKHKTEAKQDSLAQFVSVVLADTEDVWTKIFEQNGKSYKKPSLVLFQDVVSSECGTATRAFGPFYCSADQKVYIDLLYYEDLKDKFGVEGDFAFAYTIAHEIGHHVQNLLGTIDKVNDLKDCLNEKEINNLSVRLELQADFYAGVWAKHAEMMFNTLEDGDIYEALRATIAIGDDKIQRKTQGYIVPDLFTHGTSEQRNRWFRKGYESGNMNEGDTFSANPL